MDNTDTQSEPPKQPANKTIDRLSFTIQRQSAMCLEFVKHAVEAERARCAEIAEAEAQTASAQVTDSPAGAARRIAEKIRARAGQTPLMTSAARSAG